MHISESTTILIIGEYEKERLAHSLDSYDYQIFFSSYITMELENALIQYHPDIALIQIDPQTVDKSLFVGHFLNNHGNIPFIYLSSFSDDTILFKAQKTHPYCYLVKPFSPINMHISLQCALHCFEKNKISNNIAQQLHMEYDELKRKIFNLTSDSTTINFCNCYEYDVENFTLFYKNSEIKMTKQECSLMQLLIAQMGSIVDFEQIINFVWEHAHPSQNLIRTLAWRLNKKLPIAIIKNAMGIGYYIE